MQILFDRLLSCDASVQSYNCNFKHVYNLKSERSKLCIMTCGEGWLILRVGRSRSGNLIQIGNQLK